MKDFLTFKVTSIKFDPKSLEVREALATIVMSIAEAHHDGNLRANLKGYPEEVYALNWKSLITPPSVYSSAINLAIHTLSVLFVSKIVKALLTPLTLGEVSPSTTEDVLSVFQSGYTPWNALRDEDVARQLAPLLPVLFEKLYPAVTKVAEEESWELQGMIAKVKEAGYDVREKRKRPPRRRIARVVHPADTGE